jgi:hypothetical protein
MRKNLFNSSCDYLKLRIFANEFIITNFDEDLQQHP